MAAPNIRRRTRQAAVQALYQWQMTDQSIDDIRDQFHRRMSPKMIDRDFLGEILNGVSSDIERIDALLIPVTDWPIAELDPVERAILRLAAFELRSHAHTPWRTVIDEAVNLALVFGADQSHRFVNGVLDRLARRLRPEIEGDAGSTIVSATQSNERSR
ncbi:transcription antitermination factor NusB [Thioalkalivibrio sp. HK1]|uniref:transcription antitermination factor NusB n=1 Tax=Thioalkalivibrio sp. HK1 TaxID=1469245 RepID=UPI0004705425|nr:transcription antitermination factor NusB [Thioalkalivibrio sp. HK1]